MSDSISGGMSAVLEGTLRGVRMSTTDGKPDVNEDGEPIYCADVLWYGGHKFVRFQSAEHGMIAAKLGPKQVVRLIAPMREFGKSLGIGPVSLVNVDGRPVNGK